MKPFKPPTFVGKQPSVPQRPVQSSEPPLKKRRISDESEEEPAEHIRAAANVLKQDKAPQRFQNLTRKPLVSLPNLSSSQPSSDGAEPRIVEYYAVLWRKFTSKKNKIWDGDGILSVSGGYATLYDVSGKEYGRSAYQGSLDIGSALSIAGREIEIESVMSKEEFPARRAHSGKGKKSAADLKPISVTARPTDHGRMERDQTISSQKGHPTSMPLTKGNITAFKTPLLNNTVQQANKDSKVPVARHDPNRENALVMKRPRYVPRGRQIVDVVVDPLLTHGERRLREHQRAGVSFLYECVMGMKDSGEGAILADEMGLGKTLQTIALLWTLLKQNPIYEEAPVIKKALIVCPVTLINTWRREFNRWLGAARIGVFVVKDKKVRLTDFTMGKAYSVMIVGYEKLRMMQDDLQKGDGIDIVIADEGHRLKTAQNKSALAIKSLKTERRIILSGTPLQNDLAEFYTMVDFVNPGLLSKYTTFKRDFEVPIVKSQQPEASPKDKEKGEARSEELAGITSKFILRRTAEILANYLPPKTEYVLFCRPTKAQMAVYRAIINSHIYSDALGSSALSLELINILRKVCNSPNLLLKKDDKGANITKQELVDCVPQPLLNSPGASGKLQVLDSLLHHIRTTTDEKVVLISNYTSTLDVLGNLLASLSYKFERLDGSTPANKRQDIVDRFNRTPASAAFVFLLSAKAGGTGLNLHGASRLVLFDLDWNPATDLQAMARVHRDGQKKPCYIYRLVTQGALDEKIFQRQVSKTGLADSIVDGKNATSSFTREELRDLFSLDEGRGCQTHTLLGCSCGGRGTLVLAAEDEDDLEATSRNDLATLSVGSDDRAHDENGTEIVHLDNDDRYLVHGKGGWIKATDYDRRMRETTDCADATSKAKMLSLMQYGHLDTSLVDIEPAAQLSTITDVDKANEEDHVAATDILEGTIEDSVLRTVLREGGRRIGFVFSKTSG